MARILIVGGVAGGMSAAARLRRMDENAEIIVFEKGDYVSFANCGLPYYIGGSIKERDKLLLQTPEAFKARFNVEVRVQSEVVAIDRKAKKITVKNAVSGRETSERYDKLILSPGAEPIKPPIPGINHPSIYTLRNIPDTDKIKTFLDNHKVRRAMVVGAGFIGLEMAENLRERGIFVTVVEAVNQVMNVLDYEMAAVVHQQLKSKKVELYLSDGVNEFADSNGRVTVKLKSGKEVTVDMVILSIGVKPDIRLAEAAGLEIGGRKGISVNEYLQTSDPDIYAVGDAIEILNPVTGKKGVIPLAWPANAQGRIAADNIVLGNKKKYGGSYATAIAKVFDLTIASTGATEKLLKAEGIPYHATIIHPNSHAGYYPNALQMSLKLCYTPKEGKILGAQGVGYDGVDKRIDVIALAIHNGNTIFDLTEAEHTYAPPYSSAKDPVNMLGFVAENVLSGDVKQISYDQIDALDRKDNIIVDVRTKEEIRMGMIEGAVHIPIDELRARMGELPKDKHIVLYCRVGIRGYIGARILSQNGYRNVSNLSGGFITYSTVHLKQENKDVFGEDYDTGMKGADTKAVNLSVDLPSKTIDVDATGLQCPGPIMKLKTAMDSAKVGDKIKLFATDPGFANDVEAWTKATKNTLLSLHTDKGKIEALIEKMAPVAGQAALSAGNDKTIIVFSNDLDKVIASFIICNGALSMGRKVTMFFTFWGTSALRKTKTPGGLKKNIIEKMFGWMLPKGTKKLKLSQMNMAGMGAAMIRMLMKTKKVGTIEELIENAIAHGVNIVACQMSMDLMGIRKEELIDGVNIGGVAAYLEASEHADNNLFI